MSNFPVTDAISNRNEHLIEALRAIGRAGGLKHKVFEAIYYHKRRVKSVTELVEMTGLNRMQVLQSAGALKKAGIVGQDRKDNDTAYVQIESFQNLKPQIQSLLKFPEKINLIATKRNPVPMGFVSLTKPRAVTVARIRNAKSSRSPNPTKLHVRIALLVTNPDSSAPLQTMIEARDIQKAIRGTPNANRFDIRVVLAPTFADLIDELNQYDPQILHFSGHGGGGSLLLDNARAGDDGGDVLDFDMVARLLGATAAKVRLLVLAACDTVTGAESLVASKRSVVAMSDSIDDEAACAFSAQFYRSIASGATVAHSLEQAKLLLEQQGYEDADLPNLISEHQEDGDLKFV